MHKLNFNQHDDHQAAPIGHVAVRIPDCALSGASARGLWSVPTTFASMVGQTVALYNVPARPNRSKPHDHLVMTERDRRARRSGTARATPSDHDEPAR